MAKEKEIPLTIEVFSEDEEREFSIYSRNEINTILRTINARNTRSALYYSDGKRFVLTMLLAASEEGIWIDPPTTKLDNHNLLSCNEIIFVSTHDQAKVQFASNEAQQGTYEGNDAIFLPRPEKLLRLQRRDFYRLAAGSKNPLKCVFKPTINLRHFKHEAVIMDISVGGVSLVRPETALSLSPGLTYQNCEIMLPNIGTLTATVEIKSEFEIIGRNGKKIRRAGCAFVKPDGHATSLLQRYVTHMQLDAQH
jgi:c-di-GMP-binding flagellar brake protein YcgR